MSTSTHPYRYPLVYSLIVTLVVGCCVVGWEIGNTTTAVSSQQTSFGTAVALRLPSLADVAEPAVQAVVYITTMDASSLGRQVPQSSQPSQSFPHAGELFFPFRDSRSLVSRRALVTAVTNEGAGFIISPDGEILTNYHVIDGAKRILVRLANDHVYEGKVIGVDAVTDIALLRIAAATALPTVPLGRSAEVRLGDWLIAIGNPYGLTQTVTVGIVSGKGRIIGVGPYDDFIQTDAPINPGNSGGPLLNLRGEVVGISTAIVSPLDASVGIAFATPIDVAQRVLQQLRAHGVVTRGWLGMSIENSDTTEVRVTEVVKNGPARKAGVRRGDIITSYNGQPVTNTRQLTTHVADSVVGQPTEMVLRRGQQQQRITVIVEKLAQTPISTTERSRRRGR